MKKISKMLLLLSMVTNSYAGYSQASPPADFFVGKWKAALPAGPEGGPKGDVRETALWIDIARKDGKLTVHLSGENIINTRVQEERATELSIIFDTAINPGHPTQLITARDIPVGLSKVDDDNLQLTYMGSAMTATRVK